MLSVEYLRNIIESKSVRTFIIVLIIFNAIILGIETSQSIMANYGRTIFIIDKIVLGIFVLEIVVRMRVYGKGFWRDPWSIFDFSVVFVALIPASGPFAIVRALRVLRVLRLLTMVPSMQRVVGALLGAIPGLGSIGLVLLIFYYVVAVMATHFFAIVYPEWFGTLGKSLYTLFQIMTLESWSMGIVRPVMEEFPYAWAFFIPFILIATFTMLNLFIAIIVSAMQRYNDMTSDTEKHQSPQGNETDKDLHSQIQSLHREMEEIKKILLEKSSDRSSAS